MELLVCLVFIQIEIRGTATTNTHETKKTKKQKRKRTTHSGGGDHGEASVVQFLGLDVGEFLGVGGFQSERIDSDVTGVITLAQGEERSDATAWMGNKRKVCVCEI